MFIYRPIEVTIATNYIISFLYNKLPRRRVDVFAEELSASIQSALHKKVNADLNQGLPFRMAISPPLEMDPVVTSAIRSSGLTVDEVAQELPLGFVIFIDSGEVSYCLNSHQNVNAEPIPVYSTRRGINEGGQSNSNSNSNNSSNINSSNNNNSSGSGSNSNGSQAFLNPNVDAAGLLDGVDPNLLALLSIRPPGNPSSAAVPTAVFAQTKFGSTKFRSQNSGNARRPSRLNGSTNGPSSQNGASTPTSDQRSAGVGSITGSTGSRSWQSPGIVSPRGVNTSGGFGTGGGNENLFHSPSLPPVVTSSAAAILGGSSNQLAMSHSVNASSGYKPNNDLAMLLQDLPNCASSISSPLSGDFASNFDAAVRSGLQFPSSNQRHSYHGNGSLSASSSSSHHHHQQQQQQQQPIHSSSSSNFFGIGSTLGSLLLNNSNSQNGSDSGIVSPVSSWSTPTSSSNSNSKMAHNSTFSDHSNSSSSSLFSSGNSGHCDSWGLPSGSMLSAMSNGGLSSTSNAFSESNSLTGTSQWVQSLRMAAVGNTTNNGWDQLTATES